MYFDHVAVTVGINTFHFFLLFCFSSVAFQDLGSVDEIYVSFVAYDVMNSDQVIFFNLFLLILSFYVIKYNVCVQLLFQYNFVEKQLVLW